MKEGEEVGNEENTTASMGDDKDAEWHLLDFVVSCGRRNLKQRIKIYSLAFLKLQLGIL